MKVGQLVQKPAVTKLHKECDKLVDSTTLLGIEIEVENYVKPYDQGHEKAGYWVAKEDHSLRNNGMEMVFAEPLYGADSIAAVTWMFEQAVKHKWKISKLTGAHVHIDIRSMEISEFKNLCVIYALMEPLIYNWVGNGRYENLFCLPWYMADGDITQISQAIKLSDSKPASSLQFIKNLSKYSGLNINAAAKFGTVEFRMLETTFDTERFIDWLNIILSIKKHACKFGLTAESLCKQAKVLGAYSFANMVFGSKLTNKMWYPKFAQDIIGLGIVTADWFIENTKSLQLNNKSTLERFAWARTRGLAVDKDNGTHEGFDAFIKRCGAVKSPATSKGKKLGDKIEMVMPHLAAAGQWGMAVQPPDMWNMNNQPIHVPVGEFAQGAGIYNPPPDLDDDILDFENDDEEHD